MAGAAFCVQEDRPLLRVGLDCPEGPVRQDQVGLAGPNVGQAVAARHHAAAFADVALGSLAIGIEVAILQPFHQRGVQCDDSDRHGLPFRQGLRCWSSVRSRGAPWRPESCLGQNRKRCATMGLGSLNYLIVIAAAVASFVFGGIWYNVLSKQWLEAVGMPPERMQ